MIRLILTGNTFPHKDEIKAKGGKWNGAGKFWYVDANDGDMAGLQNYFKAMGLHGATKAIQPDKKYWVKESYKFNLEAMHDKLWCIIYDVRDGKLDCPFDILGKTINGESDLIELMDECSNLADQSWRPVDGKTYARIKEVVNWRVTQRYLACVNSGMSESDAGRCFEDI